MSTTARAEVLLCLLCAPLAFPRRRCLQEGVDVLVATPGRVATLLEAGVLNLEDCRAVILDEVCPTFWLVEV